MNGNSQIQQFNTNQIKELLISQYQTFLSKEFGTKRDILPLVKKYKENPFAVIVSGLRRAGKSTLLSQAMKQLYKDEEFYYVNFEDEKLINFEAENFRQLHEVLIELFGQRKIFVIDEIQNVKKWETFVRRMVDEGYKFYLTGSNAHLLSKELGTRLTGRYIPLDLFPFSFHEFLNFNNIELESKILTTTEKGKIKKMLKEYISKGGIPEALKYPEVPIHSTIYNNIIYRDIVSRYNIDEVKALKEMVLYLMSNIGNLVSFNKLKESTKLGSTTTVSNYIEYLENGWLIFTVNKYAFSVKTQQIAPKKVYAIDPGLINTIGFRFSDNIGKILENLTYLYLRKNYGGEYLYYYVTKSGKEIDFYLRKTKSLIQVCYDLSNSATRDREFKALSEAMKEENQSKAYIVTYDYDDEITIKGKRIRCIPYYEFARFEKYDLT